MGIQHTPNFGVAFMDALTPLTDLDDVTRQVAETLDAAMGRAGYTPPDSSSFAALVARVAALEVDTGWMNLPLVVASGFQPNGVPAVRRVGKLVKAVAGWQGAPLAINSTYTVVDTGGIPANARPHTDMYLRAGVSTAGATGRFVVYADGHITLTTGATLSGYYRLDPCDWFVA